MKKNGPREIVYTTYDCNPCRYLYHKGKHLYVCRHNKLDNKYKKEVGIDIPFTGSIKERDIGAKCHDLTTPDWCPVLNARN